VPDRVDAALRAGKAVGWFQGRMEYGPRALLPPLDSLPHA
jgi:predicted NodU family carbamoyl transferase